MNKVAIKKNQVWKHKKSGDLVTIHSKHGSKWIITLLDKPERNGSSSHSVLPTTLWIKFVLVK